MDSSNGSADYKLEAIRTAIADGKLTKEEISRRLTYAINKEYEKHPRERNGTFIVTCQKILYEMHTGQPYASQKEESKQALIGRLNKAKMKRRNTRIRHIAIRGLAIGTAIIVLIFGVDALLHREWLEVEQSLDDQQYILNGREIDTGLVDEGIADNDTTQPQTLTTTNLDEAIAALGYTPLMPSWLPEGWTLENYYVRKSTTTQFRIQYHDVQHEFLLRFGMEEYPDINRASQAFEQEREGVEEYYNGWTVYITENIDRCIAIWQDGTICYSLSGPITLDEVQNIIKSIVRSD